MGTKGGSLLRCSFMYSYTPLRASSGLVVISWYSRVLRGKLFSKGTMFPAQRMSPQPAATLVMYPSWMSEMCKRFASSSRSVADWFKRIKNSELASISRAVSERRSSSTFCVSPVTRPLYLRIRFHSL